MHPHPLENSLLTKDFQTSPLEILIQYIWDQAQEPIVLTNLPSDMWPGLRNLKGLHW